MPDIWLSVVIPTYNGAAYLADALQSVARQHDAGVELIAVDDGSTDGTLEMLENCAARLPLRIVRRAHTGSWVANTNLGMSLAQGRYACILHQDDYWLPGRLAALRPLLEAHADAVLAVHPAWYVDQSNRRLGRWRCPLPRQKEPLAPSLVLQRLLVQNFLAMPAPIFSRQAFLDAGGMQPRLWYTADWDLWLTLAARGPTLYCPEPLACFRIHGQSQTIQQSGVNGEFQKQLTDVLGAHRARWEERFGPLPRAVRRAAEYSVEVNAGLAGCFHGRPGLLARLLWRGLLLGPTAAARYLHDSRLPERVLARLRARPTRRLPSPLGGEG